MTESAPDPRHRGRSIPLRNGLGTAAAISLIAGVSACAPQVEIARSPLDWPWWPTRMEISDLTRVGREGSEGVRPLEVRVCFQDAEGDLTKAAGTLRVEIARSTERDEPVVVEVDLADGGDLDVGFERVTGSYLVPVEVDLPGLVPGRRLRIEVDYQGRDGTALRDVHEIALDRPIVIDRGE